MRWTCDWPGCTEVAKRITYHVRPNTGMVTAYWCEYHWQQGQNDESPDPHKGGRGSLS